MRLLPTMVVLLAMAASPVPVAGAGPASSGGLPTPELIERAVRRGDVGRSRADLFLAYALAAPTKLPARFRSAIPWDGTLPLLRLRQRLDAGPRTADREAASQLLAAGTTSCSKNLNTLTDDVTTPHFWIQYKEGTIGAGLTLADYTASLETAWGTEIDSFGWASPPLKVTPGGSRYHVAIAALDSGLYGYVSPSGTYAGKVGDNSNTPWNDVNAFVSCMVLNADFTGFPSSPQASLDSTTAHELSHSIQFGLGALHTGGASSPQQVQTDDVFIEGMATWMEDEVFDGADDSYNYLWPSFTRSMGAYPASPYAYWVVWRAIVERFGTGTSGGGEDVIQAFWEEVSRDDHWQVMTAMDAALSAEGITLADAYHDAAIALAFDLPCGGSLQPPHCLEEGPDYVAAEGAVGPHGSIGTIGGSHVTTVEDDLSLRWVQLPTSGVYDVILENTSSGGQLRASLACREPSGLEVLPLPDVAASGETATLTEFDAIGCSSALAVITNQAQTSANPASSTARSFTLSTGPLVSVSLEGTGGGTVTSGPTGIACSPTCQRTYAPDSEITLTAEPDPESAFAGWGGDVPPGCVGSTDPCDMVVDQPRDVTAAFDDVTPPGPVATRASPRPFARGRSVDVDWASTGASEFDVRLRSAGPTEPMPDDHQGWLTGTSAPGAVLQGSVGDTLCFSAMARDAAANASAWGEEACTAIPINDRDLTRRGRWALRTNGSAYLGTFSKAKKRGSKLILHDVRARRLALVATTCPRCGRVKIIMDGEVVKKASLRSSTTRKRRVILGPRFDQLETGTVRVVVLSRGRPVKIEGLGISQA